ncbi:permease (plasmid) [Gemmatirosa kalamazoonensis]|uniref:Permease n=1 Tax=Gemmatirosa kalamazoonensis TaxID=861299 RepID=W0RRE4_9BACT|nr:ABC transporter permease [Gemmatirosa kalamazoonensis]AHG93251.1 permease [Gemmatirosa kalamazoonensis]
MSRTAKSAWRYLRFWGPDPQRDLDDEIAFHIEARIEDYIADGIAPEAARTAALERFGDLTRYRGEVMAIEKRDARRRTIADVVHALVGDVRFGARQLRRNLPLTCAALLCFALGIGANTSIFSVVNAVLFRPLPFPDSERLVMVSEGLTKLAVDFNAISAPDLIDFKETEGRTFDALALMQASAVTLSLGGDAEVVHGAAITPSTFRVLRVAPALGRAFVDGDTRVDAPAVVILSDALWKRRFGGDRGVVGKTITFYGGRTAEVVGVMPPDFSFPVPGLGLPVGDVFVPFVFSAAIMSARADNFGRIAFGRLKDGVGVAQAEESLAEIARQMPRRYPDSYGPLASVDGPLLVHVKSLREAAVGTSRRPLLVLLGAVSFVLLIACINVASLFVARASARHREISVRGALGATRGRLAQQFLAEALILLGAGSVLGVIAAHWSTRMLVASAPGSFYRAFDVRIDGRVLAATAGLTVFTALVFSVLPGLRGRASATGPAPRDGGRSGTATRTRHQARRALIVAEVAMALVLTVGAGLTLRSFARARALSPGFDPEHLVTFTATFPTASFPNADRVKHAEMQVLVHLRQIPGVQAASGTAPLPMQGLWEITFAPDGPSLEHSPAATNSVVLPGFFETMRIPLRAGRYFTERDVEGARDVVIVNETMATKYYGTPNPVGRRFKWGGRDAEHPWKTIVGVVADVKHRQLDAEPSAAVYEPVLQQDTGQSASLYRVMSFLVRTDLTPAALSAPIRTAVREVDPRLMVVDLQPMNAVVGQTIAGRKFNALLLGLFALVALALAATGVYGVLHYSVIQRTREMGVRLAMGARVSDMLRLVVGQTVALACVGVVIGLAAALVLSRVMRTLLFDTDPFDVPTFAVSATLLLIVAALASYLPARRALRIDPTVAIRAD